MTKRSLNLSTLFLVGFILGCEGHISHGQVELSLAIHLTPITKEIIEHPNFKVTLDTKQVSQLSLGNKEWLFEDGEAYTLIKGRWSAPLTVTVHLPMPVNSVNIKNNDSVVHVLKTVIDPAPELDFIKQLLLPENQTVTRHIHLQPLSFLATDLKTWLSTFGLSTRLWWETESTLASTDQHTIRTRERTRQVLKQVWQTLSLSPSSFDYEGVEDVRDESTTTQKVTRAWEFVEHLNQQLILLSQQSTKGQLQDRIELDIPPLWLYSWGQQFTSILTENLAGERLNEYTAIFLAQGVCTLYNLVYEIEQQALVQSCTTMASGRVYFEKPIIKREMKEDQESSFLLTSKVVGLDETLLTNLQGTLISPWAVEHDLNFEVSQFERSDELINFDHLERNTTISPFHLPILHLKHRLTKEQVNRPQIHLRLHVQTSVERSSSREWLLPVQEASHTELFGYVGLQAHTELTVIPLEEYVEVPLKATEWKGQSNEEGLFKLSILGYEGPLLVEAKTIENHRLQAILDTTTSIHPRFEDHQNSPRLYYLWLSPLSTLNTWLAGNLIEPANTNLKNLTAFMVEFYNHFDQIQSLLIGEKTSQQGYVDAESRVLQQTNTLVDELPRGFINHAHQWLQNIQRVNQHWLHCAQSLFYGLNITEGQIFTLWKVGDPSLEQQLEQIELLPPLIEVGSEQILKNSEVSTILTQWNELFLTACHTAWLFESGVRGEEVVEEIGQIETEIHVDGSAQMLRQLALQYLLQGEQFMAQALVKGATEISLRHGIWYKKGSTWYVSTTEGLIIDLWASRGIAQLGLSGVDGSGEQVHTTPIEIQNHKPYSSSFMPLCLWSDAFMASDTEWLRWINGQWLLVQDNRLESSIRLSAMSPPFSLYEEAELDETKLWSWYTNRMVNSEYDQNPLVLPLPCHSRLEWENIPLREDENSLQLKMALWEGRPNTQRSGLEKVEKVIKLVNQATPPKLTFQVLNGEEASENWQILNLQGTHWFTQTPYLEQQAEQDLEIIIEVDQVANCQISNEKEDLLTDIELGSYTLPAPVEMNSGDAQNVFDENVAFQQRLSPEDFELITHELTEQLRYIRSENNEIISQVFKGSKSHALKVKTPPEGTSILYLRCMNVLGVSSLNRFVLTRDSQKPNIEELKLTGINESLLGSNYLRYPLSIMSGGEWREVDLLAQPEVDHRTYWARWVNTWLACFDIDSCPREELAHWGMKIQVNDDHWIASTLSLQLQVQAYTLDGQQERQVERYFEEIYQGFSDEGELEINLLDLLAGDPWTSLPTSNGTPLYLDLTLMVFDPSGNHQEQLVALALVPISPMITVHFIPTEERFDQLISQGALSEVLNGSIGQLIFENPHNITVELSVNLPIFNFEIELALREQGLAIEQERLRSSCLFNSAGLPRSDVRMIDYQLDHHSGISGRCTSILYPPNLQQEYVFSAEDWSDAQTPAWQQISLPPRSSLSLALPRVNPPFSQMLLRLINQPNVISTPLYPSPFQRNLFAEPSIFQTQSSLCIGCDAEFLLGNRILSLNQFSFIAQMNEQAEELYSNQEERFETRVQQFPWSITLNLEGLADDENALKITHGINLPTRANIGF